MIVTCWTRLVPWVGSVLFATPGFALDPTPRENLQKVSPRLFLTRFWNTPKIINPISPISCWLSLLVIFDFPSYWCIISVVGYHCCCIFLVIGYHQCCRLSSLFPLLTYPVVGDHSLKLEKPLFALLLHKLHQTCLFHAIAVDISWNETKSN